MEEACHDGLDITAATLSNTAEVASKNPVSRKRQADEVDLANVITTARACKAPKRADTEF
ncbi:hypothetical protein R3P38DRAFT_3185067 [Favolaschia claudopus]|uniref:Uncharacterized protein n=1 Tax=Favolaschia claudopus TaxID=2862362 RepID=A0AAW0C6T8_9AGAR